MAKYETSLKIIEYKKPIGFLNRSEFYIVDAINKGNLVRFFISGVKPTLSGFLFSLQNNAYVDVCFPYHYSVYVNEIPIRQMVLRKEPIVYVYDATKMPKTLTQLDIIAEFKIYTGDKIRIEKEARLLCLKGL